MTDARRQAVLAEAASWIGTPYHHEGDVKGHGVDCAMLLVRVYAACSLIPAIDPRPYPQHWFKHRGEERYLAWLEQYGKAVSTPEPADVAVWLVGRTFSHGAVVVEWPRIIHAYAHEHVCGWGDGETGFLAGRERRFYRIGSLA